MEDKGLLIALRHEFWFNAVRVFFVKPIDRGIFLSMLEGEEPMFHMKHFEGK